MIALFSRAFNTSAYRICEASIQSLPELPNSASPVYLNGAFAASAAHGRTPEVGSPPPFSAPLTPRLPPKSRGFCGFSRARGVSPLT